MKFRCLSLAFFGILTLPLNQKLGWEHLEFSNAKRNDVEFTGSGLHISVKESSSPLFFRLKELIAVTGVRIKGELLGIPNISSQDKEGQGSSDDFPLRVGLVSSGEQELNWFQKLFAPRWIKEVSERSQPYSLGRVLFLTVGQTLPVGFKRKHPKSELLEEEVVLQVSHPGAFEVSWKSPSPINTYALWLQSDGDDTRSSFEVLLKELSLESR